jgi:hypothetical protein
MEPFFETQFEMHLQVFLKQPIACFRMIFTVRKYFKKQVKVCTENSHQEASINTKNTSINTGIESIGITVHPYLQTFNRFIFMRLSLQAPK